MADHASALALVFGGCCSNALSLEQLTAATPGTGTLLTFLQFLLITTSALPNVLSFQYSGSWHIVPQLRERIIPLGPYVLQVALFLASSRLNNAAFAYAVPMSVHIVFRSGGVVISLILGRLILGRRYTFGQVLSVMAVSVGVLLTTLSASQPIHPADDQDVPASSYATGIGLLSIALVMSGLLGLVQDRTFSRYAPKDGSPPPWKEAMFYIHALALPLFLPSIPALRSQLLAVMSSRLAEHTLPKPVLEFFPPLISKGIMLPSAVLPLALTLATHLPCAAGANALTSTMSSTSVALTLATRKAVSLVISTVILGHAPVRHPSMMSAGAALVFGGSVGWAWAGARTKGSAAKGVWSDSKKNKTE